VKRLSEQTLYEILEVPSDAAPAEIEAAYERARSLYAPGSLATYALMSAEEAALLERRIEEARSTLLDPGARSRYDEALAREPEPRPQQGQNGAAGALTPVPPVIPAAHQAAPLAPADPDGEPDDEDGGEDGGEADSPPPPAPGVLLGAAARSAGAPADAASRSPIRLEREVGGPAASGTQEPPRSDVAEWTGDALRAAREARGITVQQIADRTKVTRHHIENIEAERFGALPAPVYLRGILLSFARELRLDGQKVARSYLERAGASAPPPAPPAPKSR
jgi:curved DNA-binding protein CbpA